MLRDIGIGMSRQTGVGALIGTRRRAAGLTQQQLAERSGVSVGAIRDLEQGRTAVPRKASAESLTRVLGLGGDYLAIRGESAVRGQFYPSGGGRPSRGIMSSGFLKLRVLGPLSVTRGISTLDPGSERLRTVLALLALNTGTAVHRESIIDAIWGQAPPPSAVSMVQSYISQLRQVLGISAEESGYPGLGREVGLLTSAGASYLLSMTADQLDLVEFTDLAARARRTASAGDAAQACEIYEQAVRLWYGEPMADVPLLRGHPAVTGLSRQRAAITLDFASAAFAARKHEVVLEHLQALADREPLDERAHAWLMLALAATGQQAAALKVFEALRMRLDQELGISPSHALLEAHVLVLRGGGPGNKLPGGEAPVRPTGLVKQSRKSGVPQAQPRLATPRQLPPATPLFTGRADELKVLREVLDQSGQHRGTMTVSTIEGMAGVGKTALAVRLAHEGADQFPDGQLFADLCGFGPSGAPVDPYRVIRWFLAALGVSAQQIPSDAASQAALYRSVLADKRVLVVLDNARDADQVRPLLPGSPGCQVVVTSRSRLTGLAILEGAHRLCLDVLVEPDSYQLLVRRLGTDRLAADSQAARDLIELCGGLPLALTIITVHAAAHSALPLTALVQALHSEGRSLDALETWDAASSLREAVSWSYRQLTETTAHMFRLLGRQANADISVPAAAHLAGISHSQASHALTELANAHMLTELSAGRYVMHRLLRTYALEQGVGLGIPVPQAGFSAAHPS